MFYIRERNHRRCFNASELLFLMVVTHNYCVKKILFFYSFQSCLAPGLTHSVSSFLPPPNMESLPSFFFWAPVAPRRHTDREAGFFFSGVGVMDVGGWRRGCEELHCQNVNTHTCAYRQEHTHSHTHCRTSSITYPLALTSTITHNCCQSFPFSSPLRPL